MVNARGVTKVGGVVLLALASSALIGSALVQARSRPPTQEQIDFASEAADLLQAELFAALLQEFDETTPENTEQGKLAISLIFADQNDAFRLVGDIDPLGHRNAPQDAFEAESLALALNGQSNEQVQKVRGRYYVRRSIPLSNFSPACVLCHPAFGPPDTTQWVGALMLNVPTERAEF